jgi:hypothetical protein
MHGSTITRYVNYRVKCGHLFDPLCAQGTADGTGMKASHHLVSYHEVGVGGARILENAVILLPPVNENIFKKLMAGWKKSEQTLNNLCMWYL